MPFTTPTTPVSRRLSTATSFPNLGARGTVRARGGGQVGAQPASSRLSFVEIARQKKQQEEDDFRRLVLQLEPLEALPELPNECCRLIRDEKDHLTIENFKLQAKLGEARNVASTRESENWDLTDKVYELEGQVRTLTNANEDGERQRGCLEKELIHYKGIVSQLSPAASSDLVDPSDGGSQAARSIITPGEDGSREALSSALPTSRSPPFDVCERASSEEDVEMASVQDVDPATLSRLADLSMTTTSPVVPRPTQSSTRPLLVSRPSRTSLLNQLFANAVLPESTSLPASPSTLDAAFEDAPIVGSETNEVAKKDREGLARGNEADASMASPGVVDGTITSSTPQSVAGSASLAQPSTSSLVTLSQEKDSAPVPAASKTFLDRIQDADRGDGATPTTTPTAAPPVHLVAAPVSSAAPKRRQPLGPSTTQAAAVDAGSKQMEGALMERVKGVLSKAEVKTFRNLVTQHDSSKSGVTRETDLIKRLKTLFLPVATSSSGSPVKGMAVKDRVARKEVLDAVVRHVRER